MSQKRTWMQRVAVAIAATTVLAITGQQLIAQTATPIPVLAPTVIAPTGVVELRGVVSAQNATTLAIAGQIIDITGAQVAPGVGIGQRVRVRAVLAGPNLWRAQTVELFSGDDFLGPVVTPEVGITPIIVPTATLFPAPVVTPEVGQVNPPVVTPEVGQFGAAPFTDEFELVGTLDSVNGQTIVVSGLPINIAGAEIRSTLTVGNPIKVHLSMVNGVLTAREVDDEDDLIVGGQFPGAPVSANMAIAIVRSVLPNATIREIELERRADGSPIWKVHTTDNHELFIDAQTGVLLAIELSGRGGDDDRGRDDRDDNSGPGNSDDRDDDNSGHGGGDDRDDDDHSGSGHGGSDDDGDDNSGHGGDDD